jgi:enoyl-[acyl-carrier protein] reductase II
MQNRITELFGIDYPIIQAGMIWCSDWRLASAVSNAGALGLIGSGSMYPAQFEENLIACKKATGKPFGVNIPLLYPQSDEIIEIVIKHKVPLVFTSAGNPGKYTARLKEHGIKVVHVIANSKFALKAKEAGVDAIVAEGFEAGGHNGIEESTSMVLIPLIRDLIDIPVIAAGGIADGRAMLAAMALGAEGVQIGSRFVASAESSAHENFKKEILQLKDGDTQLSLKKLVPVRLVKNEFYRKIREAEDRGASVEELKEILGRARAKKGMYEGDMIEGELEIGQVSALINHIKPAGEIIKEIIFEYENARKRIEAMK